MKITESQFTAELDSRLDLLRRSGWTPERLQEVQAAYEAKRLAMLASGILCDETQQPAPLPPTPPRRLPWWKRLFNLK